MGVLKKIKASTLMETLVATVLIVIIFMVSSLVLNNLFLNSMKFNTQKIETELNLLEYDIQSGNIKFPYTTGFDNWEVSAVKVTEQNLPTIAIEAKHMETQKTLKRTITIEDKQ